MTQTTNQVAQACGQVEASTDGIVWSDISGSVMSVTGAEQVRKVGEAWTLEGDGAVMAGGKLETVDVVLQMIYTEQALEAYEIARAVFEEACGGNLYLRWSPAGGNVGDNRITSGKGYVPNFQYPNLDATGAGPIITSMTVKVPTLSTAAIAS